MDADLSHDPADLPRLIAAVEDGADLAVGSRYVPGGTIPEWSLPRRVLSREGNRYASAVLRLPIIDATSGFRAYKGDVLAAIDLDSVRADGYGFQIEMVHRVAEIGGSFAEVPIVFTERTEGQSKMSAHIVIEALALVTWWGVRDRLRRRRPST
jgi:dolichol-phosphate mannosyltransferase